jgi:tetratricopeptide (TPR) repeat protein
VRKTFLIALFSLFLTLITLFGLARMPEVLASFETAVVPGRLVFTDLSGQEWPAQWMVARAHVRLGQEKEALKIYAHLLAIHPELIEARWEWAQLLLAMERYTEAESNLEILLETKPDNLAYQQAQGILLLVTGRMQRAVFYLARVWAGDNERFDVGMRLYQSYMSLGETQKALPVLEVLHRKKPDDLVLQQALFRLYVNQGNDQQAQALGASLANAPDAPFDLILLVAQVHDRVGLSHLAAEYWQKIILLKQDNITAHARLATYYSEQGRGAEALPHLLHGYGKDPKNSLMAGRIGSIYAGQNDYGQAIPFLEQFLLAYPDDAGKTLVLAQSYQALGSLENSSRLFSRYLELVTDPTDEIRLQAAQVFVETGEKKKAVSQYQNLVAKGGDGEKHLLSLAKNLAASGRYDEALKRWQQIAAAQPQDLTSRLEIAALFEKLGRRDQMVSMLQEIHALDATNYLVALRLAEYYFLQGRDQEGWQLFTPLLEMEFFSPDYLAIRARIFHFLGLAGHAFKDMAEVVVKENAADKNRLIFLEIAGTLGRLDVVVEQSTKLADKPVFIVPAGRLVYARALGRAGEIVQAEKIYEQLLAESDVKNRVQARLDAAEMYRLFGFSYEAEQQYRLAWLDGHDQRALFGLIDLNIFLGQMREAESWLEAIPGHLGKNRCQRSLYELRVLNGLEEFDDVLYFGKHLLSGSSEQICSPQQRVAIKLQMAKAHFGEGDDDLSLSVLTSLVAEKSGNFSAYAQLFDFHTEMGEDDMAKNTLVQALDIAGYDPGLLASLLEIALGESLYPLASGAGRQLSDTVPNSLGYFLRFIRVLELNGELDEAYSLVGKVLVSHGDNAILNLFGARLALSSGHYEKGLAMADKALAQNPDWYAALLVKARLQWALFHWTEAIAIYDQALQPPVGQQFLEKCAEEKIVLPPQEEVSLWMKVIQPMGRPDPLQRSLGVDFVMSGNYEDVAHHAALFYADYKWQMLMTRELNARNSVKRREYHLAVKQYKSLLREQDDTTLLFDLAGVYSSLDRVGDEAMVYQRLQRYNQDFPGLNEAIARNHLKLQPQTGVTFSQLQKKGRDGYYDINQKGFGISGWLSPKPQKEIKVSSSRIHYESTTSHDSLYANRVDIHLASNFFDYLQFQASVGGHVLSANRGSVGLYDFSVTGLAGDRFESYIGVKRQVVNDTLASVERRLMATVYEARAELDLMPRLQAGGELRRTEYSDDNEINGYSIWLSSVLLPEPHFLKATFRYEFLDAQEGNEAIGVLFDDGFAADDHPYWSPGNFERNHFLINYKHKFSDDVLGRSTPSFFTVGYGFSYDVYEDTVQVFQAGFNIEINPDWILKVETEFEESDEYRTQDALATLLYRW